MDDGSSDNTLTLAFDWARRDSRLRVIKANHGGPSRALNRGIAAARYDWLAIMNDDDISLPRRLEYQLKASRRTPGVVAWGSYAYHLSANGRILGLSKAGPTSEEEFYKTREHGDVFTIIHPTALLKKDIVLRAGGYDPAFDTAQDMDLFDRMADYGPIVTIPEPLVLYRIHASADTMARFPRQRTLVRYLRARRRAKTTGQPVPTLGEFTDQQSRRPALYRSRIWLDDMSQYYYRCAGGSLRRLQIQQCILVHGSVDNAKPLACAWPGVAPESFGRRPALASPRFFRHCGKWVGMTEGVKYYNLGGVYGL